jgi:hypothetical protein
MASQAAIFAETISGMKKAVKRKAYGKEHISYLELIWITDDAVLQIRIRTVRLSSSRIEGTN